MSDFNRFGRNTIDQWGVRVQDVFTRPADTTAYGLNDVISATVSDTGTTVLRGLAGGRYPGKPFWINYLRLDTNLNTFVFTPRIWLYNVAAPPTAISGDNVAMSRVYANVGSLLGFIDLPAMVGYADYASAWRDDVRFMVTPNDTLGSPLRSINVFYRIEIVVSTPTPASGQSFTLTAVTADN